MAPAAAGGLPVAGSADAHVYLSRRNLALRTRIVMDFLIEQTREVALLLEQGAEMLT